MKKNNNYQIAIIRPGGNDQLLIKGIVENRKKRWINDRMIEKFPNVEQVSFYEYNPLTREARLELAGGEFCGNATRSLSYLILNGKKGKISVKVSGTNQILTAGVKKEGTSFAQMPIYKEFDSITDIKQDLYRVELEGITHLICTLPLKGITEKKLIDNTKTILEKENLLQSVLAAGVMYIEEQENVIILRPVVWVRDIKTILYETACASGSTAVGLWKAKKEQKAVSSYIFKQPSGACMNVYVQQNNYAFEKAFIEGPITLISERRINI